MSANTPVSVHPAETAQFPRLARTDLEGLIGWLGLLVGLAWAAFYIGSEVNLMPALICVPLVVVGPGIDWLRMRRAESVLGPLPAPTRIDRLSLRKRVAIVVVGTFFLIMARDVMSVVGVCTLPFLAVALAQYGWVRLVEARTGGVLIGERRRWLSPPRYRLCLARG